LFLLPAAAWSQETDEAYRARVLSFSKKVDALIYARQKEAGVKPAEPAGHGTFFRRVNIDLVGRIPELTDIDDYLSDDSADKRWTWVERMLANPRYAPHLAAVFRAQILGSLNQMTIGFQPGFESFLQERFAKEVGYDKIVHEILTTGNTMVAPRFGGGVAGGAPSNPAAFFFANENKPENLAAATTRVFLGVKLECAQCHAHPFAKWTRDQFWEFAAFYSGRSRFAPRPVVAPGKVAALPKAGEIEIPGTKKIVKAKFLDGVVPPMGEGAEPQNMLADWVVSPKNPYFAKATVDFVWSSFFGVSILEPILEPSEDSPITHPELLDMLAKEFVESKYNVTHLIRILVHTEAYQRASGGKEKLAREDYDLFVRMPVRGMTPEQLFDSVAEATAMKPATGPASMMVPMGFGVPPNSRAEFLTKFVSQDRRHETQTSILQALYLMNGKFLNERLDPTKNPALERLLIQPTDNAKKIRSLYMMVLSRQPRAEELTRLTNYVDAGGPTKDAGKALTDVYWALLNSGEFMLNH